MAAEKCYSMSNKSSHKLDGVEEYHSTKLETSSIMSGTTSFYSYMHERMVRKGQIDDIIEHYSRNEIPNLHHDSTKCLPLKSTSELCLPSSKVVIKINNTERKSGSSTMNNGKRKEGPKDVGRMQEVLVQSIPCSSFTVETPQITTFREHSIITTNSITIPLDEINHQLTAIPLNVKPIKHLETKRKPEKKTLEQKLKQALTFKSNFPRALINKLSKKKSLDSCDSLDSFMYDSSEEKLLVSDKYCLKELNVSDEEESIDETSSSTHQSYIDVADLEKAEEKFRYLKQEIGTIVFPTFSSNIYESSHYLADDEESRPSSPTKKRVSTSSSHSTVADSSSLSGIELQVLDDDDPERTPSMNLKLQFKTLLYSSAHKLKFPRKKGKHSRKLVVMAQQQEQEEDPVATEDVAVGSASIDKMFGGFFGRTLRKKEDIPTRDVAVGSGAIETQTDEAIACCSTADQEHVPMSVRKRDQRLKKMLPSWVNMNIWSKPPPLEYHGEQNTLKELWTRKILRKQI